MVQREQDFIGTMDNLQLPHPRHVLFGGNLRSGRPLRSESGRVAPLPRSYAGLDEITPDGSPPSRWITILDVRSHEEWLGPDGRVLEVFTFHFPTMKPGDAPDRPVVVACYAGSRPLWPPSSCSKTGSVANLRGAAALEAASPLGIACSSTTFHRRIACPCQHLFSIFRPVQCRTVVDVLRRWMLGRIRSRCIPLIA